MNVQDFINKWRRVELTERSASQQHFLDLCKVFGHPEPAEADASGEWFTFERGATMQGGRRGWADVWKRGFFGWEYKGKHKNLSAAYEQLLRYRESLENPPLLVAGVTRDVAERLGGLAQGLRDRGFEPTDVARFLDRIVFCLFAEITVEVFAS